MPFGVIFDIENKQIEISNLEELTIDPEFWNDAKKAQKVVKDLQRLKKWVHDYKKLKTLVDELDILYDFFKSKELSSDELNSHYLNCIDHLEQVEFRNMLFCDFEKK